VKARIPRANEPFHQTLNPNQDVTVFSGQIEVIYPDGFWIEGDGKILFRWLPNPSLRFEVVLPLHDFGKLRLSDVSLDLPETDITGLNGAVSSISPSSSSMEVFVTGVLQDDLSMPDPVIELKELAFDVPNYHRYLGDPVERGEHYWRGRLTLEADPWIIDIDATSDAGERIKAVRSAGGYVITHAGSLRRKDGSSFCSADTSEIRNVVSMWLALTRGFWCSPLFWHCRPDGWVHFSVPRLSRWRGVRSWFPYEECGCALAIFPELSKLLADPIWKDPMRLAIYWYIHANENSAGDEGSIMLIQAALEMLAWTYLVEHKCVLNKRRWDKLNGAAARLEKLLIELEIPIDFPSAECPSLHEWSESNGKDGSGISVIVAIRNAFVHPEGSNLEMALGVPSCAKMEARTLSLLYLEIIILSLLEYDGPIYSRLQNGHPSEVRVEKPWVVA